MNKSRGNGKVKFKDADAAKESDSDNYDSDKMDLRSEVDDEQLKPIIAKLKSLQYQLDEHETQIQA